MPIRTIEYADKMAARYLNEVKKAGLDTESPIFVKIIKELKKPLKQCQT